MSILEEQFLQRIVKSSQHIAVPSVLVNVKVGPKVSAKYVFPSIHVYTLQAEITSMLLSDELIVRFSVTVLSHPFILRLVSVRTIC